MEIQDYLQIAPIAIVLIVGTTALILGRKGINRTTLVFAWLVLVSATGFIYLAANIVSRESEWRRLIRGKQENIGKQIYGNYFGNKFFIADDITDEDITELRQKISKLGGTISNTKTIRSDVDVVVVADLENVPLRVPELNQNRENKIEVLDYAGIDNAISQTLAGINTAIIEAQREQSRIETWRNRNWKANDFTPPECEPDETKPTLYQVKKNAKLEIALSAKDIEKPSDNEKPLNEGAILSIFHLNSKREEHGFLGVFSIETIKQQGGTVLLLELNPLATPDEFDVAAWEKWEQAKGQFTATVYEDLPTASGVSADALTALLGTEVETTDNGSVTTGGLEGMRRDLLEELSAINVMSDSISLAKAATERERNRKKQTASDLEKDRDAWAEDQQFAQAALEKLQSRTSRLQKTILDTRTRISELRTELAELNGRLMAEGNQKQQAGEKSAADSGATALR